MGKIAISEEGWHPTISMNYKLLILAKRDNRDQVWELYSYKESRKYNSLVPDLGSLTQGYELPPFYYFLWEFLYNFPVSFQIMWKICLNFSTSSYLEIKSKLSLAFNLNTAQNWMYKGDFPYKRNNFTTHLNTNSQNNFTTQFLWNLFYRSVVSDHQLRIWILIWTFNDIILQFPYTIHRFFFIISFPNLFHIAYLISFVKIFHMKIL